MKIVTILTTASIREALKKIGQGNYKCILVVDKNERLLGTLSDGDIRRAILKKFDINSSITKIYNKHPKFILNSKFNKKRVKELFSKQNLDIIPIVDSKRKIVKVYNWQQIFNKKYKKKINKNW